jgi:hypothetical protein
MGQTVKKNIKQLLDGATVVISQNFSNHLAPLKLENTYSGGPLQRALELLSLHSRAYLLGKLRQGVF